MRNEEIIQSIYERIIDNLMAQIVDLKMMLDYNGEMYKKLYEKISPNFESKAQRVDIMAAQNLTAAREKLYALLNMEIKLEFPIRIKHTLSTENIYYLGDLVQKTERDLLRIPNLSKISLNKIKSTLEKYSLSLNMNVLGWIRPSNPSS